MKRNQRNKQRGNGEGTIYKSSKTGLYVGQYVTGGKRHSVYQKKNEKIGDFKKRFNDILSSINVGTYIEKSNDKFIDVMKKYVEQKYIDGNIIDSTYLRDLQTVNLIEKTCTNFINKPIQKIIAEDIENAKPKLREYSQNTIDKAWQLISKVFRLSVSRRKILFNIMDDETLKKPISKKENKPKEALTASEQKHLEEILDNEERNHKYRNLVKFQLETKMRIGEVLACSIYDVDLVDNTIEINKTLTKDKDGRIILGKHTKTYDKKTGIDHGKRVIKMSKSTRQIVRQQMAEKVANIYGLLFWDYDNNTFISYKEINAWLTRLNEKYKITDKSFSSHTLRHSGITRLREAGVDMKVIQYLVGHVEGSRVTDKVYVSVSDEFIEQELKKIQ